MDKIGTEKGCPRCGGQIHLTVKAPGPKPDSIKDQLSRLLDVGLDERVIILAQCDCPTPRIVGLRGAAVYEDEIEV